MSERPSYDELATLVAAQACVIEELRAEVAELRRRLGRDSSNSSQPPSKDSIAAKAKRRKDLSDRKRALERKPGAQPGHPAHRRVPTRTPDRTIVLPAPQECSGCGDVLAAAQDAGAAWAQLWDVLPVVLEKTAFVRPARSGARWPTGRG